jgi:hypothetical protein
MRYLLNHRQGHPGSHTYRGNRFDTVLAALDEAWRRITSGETGDFLIEEGPSDIVMNEVDVTARIVMNAFGCSFSA